MMHACMQDHTWDKDGIIPLVQNEKCLRFIIVSASSCILIIPAFLYSTKTMRFTFIIPRDSGEGI